ncbi:MAG: 7,8-didemethyl-8-hydroxy-5-deazariboflavin synthase subunit CofG [Xenococcaceae cyanobacterium]
MSRLITYSPAYTLVPTYECFNRCTYCNFRADLNSPMLTLLEAKEKLEKIRGFGVTEILILSGEVHPLSSRRENWFERIYDLCRLSLEMGFLPHTNAGILNFAEMERLKQVNVSMGLMLEQLTPELLKTVHKHAPSKIPSLRLEQLEWAGKLGIPFTTGLLLGIGENPEDWQETLGAIAAKQKQWGNIQEVILQPHSPGTQQQWQAPAFDPLRLPEVIAIAREILPDSIAIQIPPNLVSDPNFLLQCLEAGVRDLGGIVPIDEVNPDYDHLDLQFLKNVLHKARWQLQPRLPVYPQYYNWLPSHLQRAIDSKIERVRFESHL